MRAELRLLALSLCLISCSKNLNTGDGTSPVLAPLSFTLNGLASDAAVGPDEDVTLEFSGGDEGDYDLQFIGFIAGTLVSNGGNAFVDTQYTTPLDCTGGVSLTFLFSDGIDTISRTILCRPLGFSLNGVESDIAAAPDEVINFTFTGGDVLNYQISTPGFVPGTLSGQYLAPAFTQLISGSYTAPSDCTGGNSVDITLSDGTGASVTRTISCGP